MPAAVAVPLISTAVGAGTSIYAANKAKTDQKNYQAQVDAQQQYQDAGGGGGGGGSSSGGSWSKGGTVIDPEVRNTALGASQGFLADGGLSQEDLHNLRARAATPIRAAYSNAEREIGRQRSLQGGYSPNATAALSRMAREQGQATADAAQSAEAGIAGMRQQGKMAGLSAIASMYGNMPNFNESQSWNNSSSSGGGPDASAFAPIQQPKGFWGNLGSGLGKVGQVALPIALNAYQNRKPKISTSPIPNIPRPPIGNLPPIAGIPKSGGG